MPPWETYYSPWPALARWRGMRRAPLLAPRRVRPSGTRSLCWEGLAPTGTAAGKAIRRPGLPWSETAGKPIGPPPFKGQGATGTACR